MLCGAGGKCTLGGFSFASLSLSFLGRALTVLPSIPAPSLQLSARLQLQQARACCYQVYRAQIRYGKLRLCTLFFALIVSLSQYLTCPSILGGKRLRRVLQRSRKQHLRCRLLPSQYVAVLAVLTSFVVDPLFPLPSMPPGDESAVHQRRRTPLLCLIKLGSAPPFLDFDFPCSFLGPRFGSSLCTLICSSLVTSYFSLGPYGKIVGRHIYRPRVHSKVLRDRDSGSRRERKKERDRERREPPNCSTVYLLSLNRSERMTEALAVGWGGLRAKSRDGPSDLCFSLAPR